MLNELRELSICLTKAGITTVDLHPNFKACPKYPSYKVSLDKEGHVADIVQIPTEQIKEIRKWEGANGVSFPAFNMPPLLKASSEELKKQIEGLKKKIKKGDISNADEVQVLVASCETLWKDGIMRKLGDCLTRPIADISSCLENPPVAYKSISELITRTRLTNATNFKEQLSSILIQKFKETSKLDLIEVLFFYSGEKPKNLQFILELTNSDQFEYPVNHQEVQRWMNQQFVLSGGKEACFGFDAFGCNASGKDDKFPPVGFKNALGNVILRAMNKESPCQTRYGMTDFHSFPAGKDVRKDMKGALEWIGADERKGKTWSDLSRRMERPMLLFAYPSVIPKDLPNLAGMMGEPEEDQEIENNEETFSVLAEKVAHALMGKTKETVDCEIRVFVLTKMDKARTKVMASNRYTALHVIRSAQDWKEGCQNIPPIEIRNFGKKKGDKPTWEKTLIPFPTEVIWCLNTVWLRQGTHAEGAHGFSINDSLSLLLGDGADLNQVAVRGIGALLRNSASLLTAVGQANTQGLVLKTDGKYSKQLRLLPSIIGLLLYKLGHKKGGIMTSSAFLIGRLLNLADSLHLEYCKHVRKNSIPPQLVGNALMATALETPEKAISILSQRILPYQAWARTVKGGEEVGLAKFFLKNIGEVSEKLKETALPQRSSDADKAQMLLGYLVRHES